MTDHPEPVLADAGESGLLAQVFPRLSATPAVLLGPGDDAAVVAAPDGRFVVTTDALVQDVDFRLDWSTAADVGWKAAMQNLADVAAMGAVPSCLVVALVAPADTPVSWAVDLMQGLADAAGRHGAAVVGGDLSSGRQIVISVTAFGDLAGRAPVPRDGARPGDVVAVAGESGWAAAGLALLEAGVVTGETPEQARALDRQRRPAPPVELGAVAARAGATAMLDTSDGLLRDLGRIARASGVSIVLDPQAPPLRDQVQVLAPLGTRLGVDPRSFVLGGGEDHCLAATFGPDATVPRGFRAVGRVMTRGDRDVLGPAIPAGTGFDHFRRS